MGGRWGEKPHSARILLGMTKDTFSWMAGYFSGLAKVVLNLAKSPLRGLK